MPSAAPAPVEPGPPKTELQELQMKAGQVTDDVSTLHTLLSWYLYLKYLLYSGITSHTNTLQEISLLLVAIDEHKFAER